MASDPAIVSVRVVGHNLEAILDPRALLQAEAQIVERGVEIMEPLARQYAPRRTGRGATFIRGKIERSFSRSLSGLVTGGSASTNLVGLVGPIGRGFYLRILSVGARPHEITPFRYQARRGRGTSSNATRARRAFGPARSRGAIRALRFRAGGEFIFRAAVHHPGLRARAFLETAARAGEPRLTSDARDIVARAVGGT